MRLNFLTEMKQMQDRFFLDTNILLYAFSTKDVIKHNTAKELVLSNAVISVQVINEVSVNLIKKLKLNEENVRQFIDSSYHYSFSKSIFKFIFKCQ